MTEVISEEAIARGRTMAESLGIEFPKQIARCRDILTQYESIPTATFSTTMIRVTLKQAQKAWDEQDTVAMIKLYPELQAIK